eukprot:CAMPEP_0119015548 /NCGR_PEP_ID=MMETSP1176-20130426/11216_1 /TAXON_ID=265551 /ORGANISM="Synedropsis recta cf, Strain CCMP1620" /LENGTH=235 /DNA_ID=CAMNT_0006968853 /DNA_START=72 /DNA_END=776 /DNA_ORIENTATION=+
MGKTCDSCTGGPMKGFCPFSLGLFLASTAAYALLVKQQRRSSSKELPKVMLPTCQVVFVLGGPGAGKGTQCQLLKERMGWAHLSAGDLLRAERKRGGPMADLINSKIDAGQIVPAEITCGLLQQGMEEAFAATQCTKFLVDGFPRSQGNVTAWEATMAHHTIEFVLNFECPEEVLVGRLLERGQTSGRKDDEIDVIRKRFQTFQRECKPIVDLYTKQKMVRSIQSDQSVDAVYEE